MDLDAEMARLSAEARKKLDAERTEPAPAQGPGQGEDVEVEKEVRRLADDPAEEGPRGPKMSLGAKIAVGIGALIALNLAFVYVIKPLVGIAVVLGVVALLVLGVMKLLESKGDGDDDADAGAKRPPG